MYTSKQIVQTVAAALIVFLPIVGIVGLFHHHEKSSSSTTGTIQIVAGENFWGSLAMQLGGSHVHVTSVVADPNADPHEYTSSVATARAFATASYVILNGAGYDSWGDKLLSASSSKNRTVLNVADLLGKKEGDNPHFWYNPAYVNQTVAQMEHDLIKLDPGNTGYYQRQYKKLQTSLDGYQSRIAHIKTQLGGTEVAATEDIFAYLASAAGLNLISPPAFIQAVAEGNDPPTNSVVQFQQQLQSVQPKVLVYNQQTVTPLTDSVKKLAAQHRIPVIGVTETIQPSNASFQDWMNAQVINLENALNTQAQGQ